MCDRFRVQTISFSPASFRPNWDWRDAGGSHSAEKKTRGGARLKKSKRRLREAGDFFGRLEPQYCAPIVITPVTLPAIMIVPTGYLSAIDIYPSISTTNIPSLDWSKDGVAPKHYLSTCKTVAWDPARAPSLGCDC